MVKRMCVVLVLMSFGAFASDKAAVLRAAQVINQFPTIDEIETRKSAPMDIQQSPTSSPKTVPLPKPSPGVLKQERLPSPAYIRAMDALDSDDEENL